MDTNCRREVILKQLTKIQIRLVVHRNVIITNDQSARLRLNIVRMTVMMTVQSGQNTRNDDDRRRVNVAIRRTRNQVDRVSTPITIEIVRLLGTGRVGVRHIQAPNTNRDRVPIQEIDDRIIGISLRSRSKSVSINLCLLKEWNEK